MDVLRTDHSAVNGVEWYSQTLNDALQTQCAVTERSVTAMRTICLFSREVVHRGGCDRHVDPSHPPASNGHISALQLFGFVQHDYRFS
ncbi:hypothetical protein TNCV_2524841 [Trichonephila clavipes]|nr:hypothetical protein TNCV_2524841 [Trichonephila clavipes]